MRVRLDPIVVCLALGASSAIAAFGSVAVSAEKLSQAESDAAAATCVDIAGAIGGLTATRCTAAAASDGTTFILFADERVLADESSKKAWLLMSLGAVGYVLNEKRPAYPARDVFFCDADCQESKTGYAAPASLLKSLQKRVKHGEINFDAAYSELLESFKSMKVPARKP